MDKNDFKNIKERLLYEMKEGIYSACSRLPRETVLSEELSISRTQLRDALAELDREGFITRRHGVGTMINRHVLQVKNRMDIETEFLDIIRQSGYHPAVESVQVREETADAYVAEKLKIEKGTPVIRFCRLCTADGRPAIYCEDVLERRLVNGECTHLDIQLPFFDFLKKCCGTSAYMDLTQLHAVSADRALAEVMQIPEGTPLLNMEEVDFDIDGNRIFYSSQYFADEFFEQTVLRKKL